MVGEVGTLNVESMMQDFNRLLKKKGEIKEKILALHAEQKQIAKRLEEEYDKLKGLGVDPIEVDSIIDKLKNEIQQEIAKGNKEADEILSLLSKIKED